MVQVPVSRDHMDPAQELDSQATVRVQDRAAMVQERASKLMVRAQASKVRLGHLRLKVLHRLELLSRSAACCRG